MRDLFTKPIETLTRTDVESVIGWPESLQVEYKRDLPGKDGRPDPWLTGGKVADFAKEKLFKEIVALANTSGGHLVIGVAETKEGPPTADGISPIPRCVDLAERLEASAQSIDPPIPVLLVRGIQTADGGSGVVLFRIPASRAAPLRSIDRECYIRRGTHSVPIDMRGIRDLIGVAWDNSERIERMFKRCESDFEQWSPQQVLRRSKAAFQISAVPVRAPSIWVDCTARNLDCPDLIA